MSLEILPVSTRRERRLFLTFPWRVFRGELRYPWDALRAWWALRKRPQYLCLKSIAVLPDYWSRGVDALMLCEMGVRAVAKGYTWGDLSITGADNPMTVRMGSRLGARIYKRWQAYIKMLDAGEDSNMGGKDDS